MRLQNDKIFLNGRKIFLIKVGRRLLRNSVQAAFLVTTDEILIIHIIADCMMSATKFLI